MNGLATGQTPGALPLHAVSWSSDVLRECGCERKARVGRENVSSKLKHSNNDSGVDDC